ncbi:MAG TPA: hypothetical protein VGX50_13105 [Longimicrobium sp.]|nr:hypothetical protein [Longimicrobium sp.]
MNEMINLDNYDLSELRARWARRRAGVEQVKARTDVRGMTRPARDPEEAAFLREAGQEGPFVEVDLPGWREWIAYRNTPDEERRGPPLTAAYFAARDRARGLLQ